MLTMIKKTRKKNGSWYGLYQCVCGTQKEIRINAVNSGSTKSCGCHRSKIAIENGKTVTTHGQTGTYLYNLWQSKIKNNCCWKNFEEFYIWIKPMWKPGLTLKPIDGYYSDQCELISSKDLKKHNAESTNLERYGTTTPFQNDIIKKKIRQTNLEKYGVEIPAKLDVVKKRTVENNRKKYGVDYPQQLPERRAQRKAHAVKSLGYDSEQLAKNIGVARSTFCAWIREYGFDIAINMTKKTSSIEQAMANILDGLQLKYSQHIKVADYFPDFVLDDLIIEVDGLYWHSDAINSNKRYHKEKLDAYNEAGYRAFFFRENEITNQPLIISSIINNYYKNSNKIFARKCNIVELSLNDRKNFFNINHLMGVGRGRCFGLEYNNGVVCALQFTNRNGFVDISRFCNKLNTTVIGGYSRLIKHMVKQEGVDTIQTFVDKRYGVGDYLKDFGFQKTNEDLSFVWVKNNCVYHRLKFRSNSGYEHGCYKLWDCGQAKYTKKARF